MKRVLLSLAVISLAVCVFIGSGGCNSTTTTKATTDTTHTDTSHTDTTGNPGK